MSEITDLCIGLGFGNLAGIWVGVFGILVGLGYLADIKTRLGDLNDTLKDTFDDSHDSSLDDESDNSSLDAESSDEEEHKNADSVIDDMMTYISQQGDKKVCSGTNIMFEGEMITYDADDQNLSTTSAQYSYDKDTSRLENLLPQPSNVSRYTKVVGIKQQHTDYAEKLGAKVLGELLQFEGKTIGDAKTFLIENWRGWDLHVLYTNDSPKTPLKLKDPYKIGVKVTCKAFVDDESIIVNIIDVGGQDLLDAGLQSNLAHPKSE